MTILHKSGNLTMAEMYKLTKSPDIAKLSEVKGQVLDIDKFIVHEDQTTDGNPIVIAAFETAQGEVFATNSRTFTQDFIDILEMCAEAGEPAPKQIKVLPKQGKTGREYLQCVYIG